VASIVPADGAVGVADRTAIVVTFSEEMDRASTADAVSVVAGGAPVMGEFRWRGRELSFIPSARLPHGKCRITVCESAEDVHGNDLEREAVSEFGVGSDFSSPRVASTSPADGYTGMPATVMVAFSEPVSPSSAARGVSLSPGVTLFREFSPDGTVLTLRPYTGFAAGTRYVLSISREVTDLEGNPLEAEERVSFTAGEDLIAPCLECGQDSTVGAYAVRGGGSVRLDAQNLFSGAVERDAALRLVFSEPMSRSSVEDAIGLSPPVDCLTEWDASGRAVTLTPAGGAELAPMQEYALTVKGSARDEAGNGLAADLVYRFIVNGPLSIPLALNASSIVQLPADGGDILGLPMDSCLRLDDGFALESTIGGVEERVFVVRAVFTREDGSPPRAGIDQVAAAPALSFESESYYGEYGSGIAPRMWKVVPARSTPGSPVEDSLDVYLFRLEAGHYYRLRVRSGMNGVRDRAGNRMRADFTIYFNS